MSTKLIVLFICGDGHPVNSYDLHCGSHNIYRSLSFSLTHSIISLHVHPIIHLSVHHPPRSHPIAMCQFLRCVAQTKHRTFDRFYVPSAEHDTQNPGNPCYVLTTTVTLSLKTSSIHVTIRLLSAWATYSGCFVQCSGLKGRTPEHVEKFQQILLIHYAPL